MLVKDLLAPTSKITIFTGSRVNIGGDDGTRTRDLCRDSLAGIGFTTTYNNAGTAKLPVSRTRPHELWVGNSASQHNQY